jgi:gp16 family phage-associated protein
MAGRQVSSAVKDVREDPDRLSRVRQGFFERGETVSQWAKSRGFPRHVVFEVLAGKRRCTRGKAHEVAVALGLKGASVHPSDDGPADSGPQYLNEGAE